MSNDALDFLTQAKALQIISANEMEHRTATNRAYYSVYHNALHIKKKLTLPDCQHRGSHAKLYGSLEKCQSRHSTQFSDIRRIGIMASRLLKPHRVHADYDTHLFFPKGAMDEVIAKAELLMTITNSIV